LARGGKAPDQQARNDKIYDRPGVTHIIVGEKRGPAAGEVGREKVRHGGIHDAGGMHVVRPEEYPSQVDAQEGEADADRARHEGIQRFFGDVPCRPSFPGVVDAEHGPMYAAPGDEGPARAVPQAADQHGQQQVAVLRELAHAASTHRNVQKITQPEAQGDVPAPPEIDNARGFIGRIEVVRQLHAEEEGHADSHVGIAGKIEIQLEGVCQRPHPRFGAGQRKALVRGIEDAVGVGGDAVRQEHFLGKADEEEGHALADVGAGQRLRVGDLRAELRVAHDGAGDDIGKEGGEVRVLKQAARLRLAAVHRDQIGNL